MLVIKLMRTELPGQRAPNVLLESAGRRLFCYQTRCPQQLQCVQLQYRRTPLA